MIAFDNMTSEQFAAFVREERRANIEAARELQRQMPDLSFSQALNAVERMRQEVGPTA